MTALIRYSWSLPSLEGTAPLARVGHTGTGVGSTRIYYFGGYGVRYGYSNETHILTDCLPHCMLMASLIAGTAIRMRRTSSLIASLVAC